LYAGGDPGVLFRSTDGGLSWELVRSLWEHPTRPDWTPGGGGLCLHSIAPWPGEPEKLALALSAVGVWLTDDGGATWRHGNGGLGARYLPEEQQEETLALCVHDLQRAPQRPERMFIQFHGGVYRSDDAGETWAPRGDGLPAEHAYLTVLREAFDRRGEGDGLELYFGATSGDVFGSPDAGASWFSAATHLPPVYSVRTA